MLPRPLMSTVRHVWWIQVPASSSSCFPIFNSVPSWGQFTKDVNRRAVETAPPPMLVAWRKLVLPSWCPCVCFVNLIEIMKCPETDSVASDKKWWAQYWGKNPVVLKLVVVLKLPETLEWLISWMSHIESVSPQGQQELTLLFNG